MPIEVKTDGLLAGYAAESVQVGEMVRMIVREFTSSEDGDLFISRLDGLPSVLLGLIPAQQQIPFSVIDNMLVILYRDQRAIVYINELQMRIRVRAKRDIQPGQLVCGDDIADIDRLEFTGIDIPDDAGVLFLFSSGWRKGLYFDLVPLPGDTAVRRDYDLQRLLGAQYAYLSFQHLFKITEAEWNELISQRWFPFASLARSTVDTMLATLRSGSRIDTVLDRIAAELDALLPGCVQRWRENVLMNDHIELIDRAVERYQSQDYISAASILYPRLEGLMRTFHATLPQQSPASQRNLVNSVISGKGLDANQYSLFLPNNFRRFLEEAYFADFDPASPQDLNRNTVSHGVAPPGQFDRKGAVLGLLTLDQVMYYMTSE